MCAKFQGQNIHSKKGIQNLPTWVVGRKIFSALGMECYSIGKVSHGCKKSFFQRHMLVEFA